MRRRRVALRWAPLVVAVLVVGLVALTGGFARAPGTGPRNFEVGQTIELRRWLLTVEGVELTDTEYDSPATPRLHVLLRVTWTGDASEDYLPTGLVTVVVPGGPVPGEVQDSSTGVYSSGFDPDVERPAELVLDWPAGADEKAPRIPAPAVVQVVVADERPSQNFLFSGEFSTTNPLGHVDVPVADRRTR